MPGGWGVGVDYIVFGTGYGATLLVLGWALRAFGPGARYQDAAMDEPASADVLVYRVAWTRFCESLGALVAAAGAVVILITFITALINPGDDTGTMVLLTCFGLVVVGTAVWTWFYVARYGVDGLIPERMDIGRLFAARERPFTQPSQVYASISPSTHEDADHVATEAESVPGPVPDELATDVLDVATEEALYFDEDESEMEVHSSRYQMHHPDESRADAYRDLFAMYGVDDATEEAPVVPEDDIVATEEFVGPEIPLEQPEQPVEEQGPESIDQHGIEPGDSGDQVDEEEDRSGEEELPVDPEPDVESSTDDTEESDVVFDHPLADTPEGRAEALRRLQAWEPDKDT